MWDLIADVGGTHMRLAAHFPTGEIVEHRSYRSDGDLGIEHACAAYIEWRGAAPDCIVVAAAGVVHDRAVTLTNARQTLSEADLTRISPSSRVRILNDFEAAAWSLATVMEDDVEMLQGTLDNATSPRLIIGPGTGLGVGALIRANGMPEVIPGEGGHVALGPRHAREVPYLEALIRRSPAFQCGDTLAVEAEALLSGTGVPAFYAAVAEVMELDRPLHDAADVFNAAQDHGNPAARIVAGMFRDALGALAGDLALAFGARGGVFVTGGVARSNRWLFDGSFLAAFNAGGRHTHWREQLPVCLYHNAGGGLLGARNYINRHMRSARGAQPV